MRKKYFRTLDEETFEEVYLGKKYDELRRHMKKNLTKLNTAKIVIFCLMTQKF